MSILFYDHLVDKTEALLFIDRLPEPENHKGKLKQLVDDIIHQGLIEYILQKLHPITTTPSFPASKPPLTTPNSFPT